MLCGKTRLWLVLPSIKSIPFGFSLQLDRNCFISRLSFWEQGFSFTVLGCYFNISLNFITSYAELKLARLNCDKLIFVCPTFFLCCCTNKFYTKYTLSFVVHVKSSSNAFNLHLTFLLPFLKKKVYKTFK